MEPFKPTPALRRFAEILMPKEAEEPILAGPVRAAVHEWMTEIWATEELAAVNVKPRRTAILFGPPGCGKTTLAHHFAARLGVPLVTLKMDVLVDSALGGTGRNIAEIFEGISGQEDRCVLFMDEFDAVATKRTEDNQACAREMNATVNALLKRIESFNGTAMAATNRADAIDPAMWRRFGMHLDVALPGFEERYAILRRYLHPLEISDENLDTLSEVTEGASPALIRQLMEGVKRALVLNPRLNRSTDPGVVFSTLLASIKPHQAYTPPPLWNDQEAFDRACSIDWPPTLNKEAA